MVLRSIPVTRSIWRWLLPASNSVAIVVCRCGFKTFNPVSLKSEGVTVTSCQGLTEAMKNGVRPPSHQGRGGGIWGGHKWGSLGGHQGTYWEQIQDALIAQIDASYGVYDGRTFKIKNWAAYLQREGIAWPRLPSGALEMTDDTFRQMARIHPQVAPIRELRSALSEMRLSNITVGDDGRNRCLLSPFSSKTGRNQPSNARFIFGPSVWLRGLIKPRDGFCLAYIDYSQQEFGIAAALSGDQRMMEAYRSGDPYLAFAVQAGAVPQGATKRSHKVEREQFKACVLAVQYGMGEISLAQRISRCGS